MKHLLVAGLLVWGMTSAGSALAEPRKEIRIGMVTTLTTNAGANGLATQRGIELALEQLGSKVGGIPVRTFFEDDQLRPEIGKQKTDKLILEDKVDFLLGYNYSNILLASLKPAIDSKTFVLSANAGPRQTAGIQCSPWFFAMRDQNDQASRALGEILNKRGIKSLYIVAPNYSAGTDIVEGITSTYSGQVVGQDLTRWPSQLDFSAEIAKIRAASPEAVFIFFGSQHAVQFFAQYTRAGLRGRIPLYSVYTLDGITLPVIGESAVGSLMTLVWSPDLDTPGNKRFIQAYRAKHGSEPPVYAATAYDSVLMIDSAVRAVGGDLDDKEKVRQALAKADFESTRGRLQFGNNQFPISDYYLIEVVKTDSGVLTTRIVEKIAEAQRDPYAKDCKIN